MTCPKCPKGGRGARRTRPGLASHGSELNEEWCHWSDSRGPGRFRPDSATHHTVPLAHPCSPEARPCEADSVAKSMATVVGLRLPTPDVANPPFALSVSHVVAKRSARFPTRCRDRDGPAQESAAGGGASTLTVSKTIEQSVKALRGAFGFRCWGRRAPPLTSHGTLGVIRVAVRRIQLD